MAQTVEKEADKKAEAQKDQSGPAKPLIEDPGDLDYEAILEAYDTSLKDFAEGEVVKGRVVKISGDNVIVDVGFKSEGVISIHEFRDENREV